MTHFEFVFIAFIFLLSKSVLGKESVYYCARPTGNAQQAVTVNVDNTQDSVIIKTRYENDTNYIDNILCEWQVNVPAKHRIQLDSFSIDLQFVPDYASCNGFDYLDVYDFKEQELSYMLSVCRNDGYEMIQSTENRVVLRFRSNQMINRKGVELRLRIWNSEVQCAPGWYRSPAQETCHLLYNQYTRATLKRSQELCNMAQANVAMFENDSQVNDFISNYIVPNKYQTRDAWVSLNDIMKSGDLRWIDTSALGFAASIQDIQNDPNNFCFYIKLGFTLGNADLTYDFVRAPCYSNLFKLAFICTMPQKKPVKLYPFPFEKGTVEVSEDDVSTFIVIGVPIICTVVVIILAIGGFLLYKYWHVVCKPCDRISAVEQPLRMTDVNNAAATVDDKAGTSRNTPPYITQM